MSPLREKALRSLAAHLDKTQIGSPLAAERELAELAQVTRTVIRGLLSWMETRGLVRREERQWVLLKALPPALFPSSEKASVSKREMAKEHLLAQLGSGALRPGQQISELAISKRLGVANISVREALLEMAPLGVFSKSKNRQWEVTEFTVDRIREMREFREIIELFCLRKIHAGGLTPDRRDELEAIREKTQLILASRHPSAREILSIDLGFHRFLLEASGNRMLVERAAFIYLIIEFQLASPFFLLKRGVFGLQQHLTILDAILAGDFPSAENHLLNHLQAAEKTFCSIVHHNEAPRAPMALRQARSDKEISLQEAERV